MTNYTPTTPPAGWYPDPAGSPLLRWWDGATWTAQLAPPPTPPPTPPPAAVGGQPYSPMQQSFSDTENFAPGRATYEPSVPIQWNTGAAFALALSPLYSVALIGLTIWLWAAGVSWMTLILLPLNLALVIVLAVRDHSRLIAYGYARRANPWLVVLFPPLLYLIVRTVYVRREVGRGGAPLWTYLSIAVPVGILAVIGPAVVIPVFLGQQHDRAESALVSTQLQNELVNEGFSATVRCPPSVSPTVGSEFTCTAVDSTTQLSHSIELRIESGADGKPVVDVVSVVPAFTR